LRITSANTVFYGFDKQGSHKCNSENPKNSTKKIPKSVVVQHKIGVP